MRKSSTQIPTLMSIVSEPIVTGIIQMFGSMVCLPCSALIFVKLSF
jgi:hypothetical protein